MKKKILFFFAMMLMSIGMAHADEAFTGVLVTTPDGATTYALSEVPRISYTKTGTTVTAKLFISSSQTTVASVVLQDGKTLKAEWATYTPTAIDEVTSDKATTFTKEGRKYITGGRLIIIGKDGKQYDAAGMEIK